jgi:hypothetical protein
MKEVDEKRAAVTLGERKKHAEIVICILADAAVD